MTHEINENSTSYLTVTALDGDGNPAQPDSATYDVIDIKSVTKIKNGEELTFTEGEVIITLDKEDAQIVDQKNRQERRLVSIHIVYGDKDELHDEYTFMVNNLHNLHDLG